MLYLYEDEKGFARLIPETAEESMRVAFSIAFGADYGQFGIDPFEAAILVVMVEDGAAALGNEELVKLCRGALRALRVHVDAFAVVVECGE